MRTMRTRIASALVAVTALASVTSCGFPSSLQQEPPPSPSASPSASPSPHASSAVRIPKDWISFSWAEAGISVRLPSTPTKSTSLHYQNRIPIALRLALIKVSPGPILVGASQFGASLTRAAIGKELVATLKGVARAGGTTLLSRHNLKFRGMRAVKALLRRNTQTFELLVFQRNPTHEVIVLAPAGDVFAEVSTSLRLR